MAALRKYPEELRQRAIRLVHEAEAEPGTSRKAVCRRVASSWGISPDTLRGWVNREEVDAGERPGIYPDGDGGTDSRVGAGGPGAATRGGRYRDMTWCTTSPTIAPWATPTATSVGQCARVRTRE